MLLQIFNFFGNKLCRFFNLESLQSLEHGLEICQKRCWRNDNYSLLLECIFNQISCIYFDRPHLRDQKVIINRFVWNKHKSEVHGVLTWFYIFCSFINSSFEICFECLFQALFFKWIFFFHETIIIFKRKLGINRDYFIFNKHHRINNRAVTKWILHLVTSGG